MVRRRPGLLLGRGLAAGLVAGLALLGGCGEPMSEQPRLEPHEAAEHYGWQQTSRPPVEGTRQWVPPQERADGQARSVPVTLDLLRRGRERYDIYCAPCHGWTGEGNGTVVRRGYPSPPSFHTPRLRRVPASFYYTVITQGVGNMASYAGRVPPSDRWAIAAYIQALQLSQNAPAELLPDRLRDGSEEEP